MDNNSRHTSSMGLNQKATGPNKGYRPTPGLIQLFSRTGTGCKNPKHQSGSNTPPNQTHTPHRRSYADVLHSRMEGKGQSYGSSNGNGYRRNGTRGFRGATQGEAYTRGGYQRPYQRYGSAGFHGGRGAGRRNDIHGRGFVGQNRTLDNRAGHGDFRQHPVTPRNTTADTRGPQQQMPGHGMTQGDQVQGQRPSRTAGGSAPSSTVEVGDLSNIPANMLALFQQFLATMS
jgi:hypothetical protein